jgi:hypothetical protein
VCKNIYALTLHLCARPQRHSHARRDIEEVICRNLREQTVFRRLFRNVLLWVTVWPVSGGGIWLSPHNLLGQWITLSECAVKQLSDEEAPKHEGHLHSELIIT